MQVNCADCSNLLHHIEKKITSQVVNPRSALLSNYEVLKLLKDRDTAQTVHARAALVKKEDTDEKPPLTDVASLVGQNVRTVQFEVITVPLLCREIYSDERSL